MKMKNNRYLVLALLNLLVLAIVNSNEIWPRDRFWRHHKTGKTIVIDGVEQYANLDGCLKENLSNQEWEEIRVSNANRALGKRIIDSEGIGPVVLVEILNAISPIHVKAVQTLAACVRKYIPALHEKRPMYIEFDMEKDEGLGGNNPTHLAPIINIFLPEVVDEVYRTLEMGFEAGGWNALVVRDEIFNELPGWTTPLPKNAGMRASEHLTYNEFPNLSLHEDGRNTAYTINFAFSGPDEYEGGDFIIMDELEEFHYIKPDKYSAMLFLGGVYQHGVSEIYGGHREMWSNEIWSFPDIPIGSNLWTSNADNLADYIKRCDEEGQTVGTACNATFSKLTGWGVSMDDIKGKYDNSKEEGDEPFVDSQEHTFENMWDESDWDESDWDGSDWDESDWDDEGYYYNDEMPRYPAKESPPDDNLSNFLSEEEEPNFFVPDILKPGQMSPLFFREHQRNIDGEAFVIGLPPKLLKEFQEYIKKNGMMEVAHRLLYKEARLREDEHKIYTLNDGMMWGAMNTGWESSTDMIWLDPADEECFESLMSVLRRGDFDVVLDAIGEHFGLEGLMIQGVGAIFLSFFDHDEQYRQLHIDIPNSQGSFYNVIVPIHIPIEGSFLYVGDDWDSELINLRQNAGVLIGGETRHGTGECDHRENEDLRLSFAIYVADINDDNLEQIAYDSTSLWPTQGDTDWFLAQKGRLWSKDGKKSLKNDKGRKKFDIRDKIENCSQSKHLCEEDPTGFRLKCPLTCKLYLEEEAYLQIIHTTSLRS